MKKLITLILALMMLLPMNSSAMSNEDFDNFFDNPVFEVVAVKKDAPSEPAPDAKLISKQLYSNYNSETDGYVFDEVRYYSDGSYTEERIFELDGYMAHPATRYFPVKLESLEGYYVGYEETEVKIGDNYARNIYLIDTNGEEVTKTLVGAMVSVYNMEDNTVLDSIYTLDENGKIADTPTYENLTANEFDKLVYGSEYNDGLKFGKLGEESGGLSGYTDINGKVYFEDPVTNYFNYFYNLGYLITASNNGYALDYSIEDPESQRVYCSTIENVFTGENYSFYDVDIRQIFDSGYALVDVKDETRKETTYIAKIKKPAVITVMVDGEKVLFDVLPSITDGRTLVPLRAIFEALGAEVEWNENEQKVIASKDDLTVELVIGSNEMTVENETKILEVPAQIVDGRTLVPARAVAEAFGCTVGWEDESRTVIIE